MGDTLYPTFRVFWDLCVVIGLKQRGLLRVGHEKVVSVFQGRGLKGSHKSFLSNKEQMFSDGGGDDASTGTEYLSGSNGSVSTFISIFSYVSIQIFRNTVLPNQCPYSNRQFPERLGILFSLLFNHLPYETLHLVFISLDSEATGNKNIFQVDVEAFRLFFLQQMGLGI